MLILVVAVILVGAVVQGALGFGFGLLAAPILLGMAPDLVPVPTIVGALALALLGTTADRGSVDWGGVGWALLGRLPGTAAGVAVVALLDVEVFSVVVAISVLLAVALSLSSVVVRRTPSTLLTGGFLSGVSGTAASIGGPPVALLYADASGAQVRATMSAFFVVGSVMSLGGLALAGEVHGDAVRASALVLPVVVLGWLLARRLRHVVDRGWTRPAVLGVASLASVLLLVRVLL